MTLFSDSAPGIQILGVPCVMIAGVVAAFLLAAILAFYWVHESIADHWWSKIIGSKPVLVLLTTVPAAVLAKWDIHDAGPYHAIAWALGMIITIVFARLKIVDDYSKEGRRFPGGFHIDLKSVVRRTVFKKGHAETEKVVSQRIRKQEKLFPYLCDSVINALHEIVHTVRDNAVAYSSAHDEILAEAIEHHKLEVYEEKAKNTLREHLRNPLEKILHLFEELVGNTTDIWVGMRMLDATEIDGQRNYRTLIRVGHVNDDREQTTAPIPENEGLPKFLKEQYQCGRGIVVMNGKRKRKQWLPTHNDSRKEDRSIIAGPIILKSTGHDGASKEMAGILYVNSRLDSIDFSGLEEYLKCCTDSISLFWCLSVFPKIQLQQAKLPK